MAYNIFLHSLKIKEKKGEKLWTLNPTKKEVGVISIGVGLNELNYGGGREEIFF